MGDTKHFVFLVLFFKIICLCSCDKFVQDDGIQWHKPEKRIQQHSWSISKYLVTGLDSTTEKKEYLHNATFRFFVDDKDSYIVSYKTDLIEIPFAYWGIGNKYDILKIYVWNYNTVELDSTFNINLKQLNSGYHILKLSDNNFIIRSNRVDIDFVGN
jgi:hypothetical protein